MSIAVVTVAAGLLAAIPGVSGDQPTLTSIRFNDAHTVAFGTIDMIETGRLVPRRLRGLPAWACVRVDGDRHIGCDTSSNGGVYTTSVRYRANHGVSRATVRVKLVAR